MPAPPGPARQPWRSVVAQFLHARYGPGEGVAPASEAFLPATVAPVARLGDIFPFEHDGREDPFEGGGRAYLARRILEVQKAGGALGDGPVARLAAWRGEGPRGVTFEFTRGRRHDDLSCGEAMASELFAAFWQETQEGASPVPESRADRADLFVRVDARLKVRNGICPDGAALHDLRQRAARLRVEVAIQGAAGTLLEWRPESAEEYPRLWALPVSEGAETEDAGPFETMARGAAPLGGVEATADTPARLGWDLITCNLVLLVAPEPVEVEPKVPGRTLRAVAREGAAEFLRRSPVTPSAAVVLAGYPD